MLLDEINKKIAELTAIRNTLNNAKYNIALGRDAINNAIVAKNISLMLVERILKKDGIELSEKNREDIMFHGFTTHRASDVYDEHGNIVIRHFTIVRHL